MSHSDLVPIIQDEKTANTVVGLGITTASIFLAGEMAGSGVLALPSAIVLTGTFPYNTQVKTWLVKYY